MSHELFVAITAAVVVAFILLELRTRSFRRGWFGDRERAKRNWSYLFAMIATFAVSGLLTQQFPRFVPSLVRFERPFVVDLVACILAGELVNYVIHYTQHRSALLWRVHFPHHLETNYDIWLSAHFNVLALFVASCLMATVLTLMGFSPLSKQIYYLLFTFISTCHHSSRNYSFGILNRVFVSPAFHRLHHSRDVRGNYSNSLTFWDVVFRTAVWPTARPVRYGIASKKYPYGFWKEFLYVFRGPKARPATSAVDWAIHKEEAA